MTPVSVGVRENERVMPAGDRRCCVSPTLPMGNICGVD